MGRLFSTGENRLWGRTSTPLLSSSVNTHECVQRTVSTCPCSGCLRMLNREKRLALPLSTSSRKGVSCWPWRRSPAELSQLPAACPAVGAGLPPNGKEAARVRGRFPCSFGWGHRSAAAGCLSLVSRGFFGPSSVCCSREFSSARSRTALLLLNVVICLAGCTNRSPVTLSHEFCKKQTPTSTSFKSCVICGVPPSLKDLCRTFAFLQSL